MFRAKSMSLERQRHRCIVFALCICSRCSRAVPKYVTEELQGALLHCSVCYNKDGMTLVLGPPCSQNCQPRVQRIKGTESTNREIKDRINKL
jgi:hypothetical protein